MSIQKDLVTRTVEDLKQLAKFYDLRGAYKLRKLELCEALSVQIQEKFMCAFEMINPEAMKLFEKVIKKKNIKLEEINPRHIIECMMLKGLGIMDVDMEKEHFFVHPEIVESYEEKRLDLKVQRELKEKQRYYSKLRKYKDACINLYGTIKLIDFIALYEAYEEALDMPSFFKWLEKDSAFYGGYYYENGYLMHERFREVSEEELAYFFHQIEDKPYYRPNKEEFLRYTDEYYYEETSEVRALRAYLNKQYPYYKQGIEDVILDMILGRRYEIQMSSGVVQEILTNFEMIGIFFNNLEEVERLVEKIVPVLNHTRIWINKGNSPSDLRRGNLASDFSESRIVAQQKVGRNESCPCGSGLKYKKCCGR